MPFQIYKGGRKPAYDVNDHDHPRVWLDDCFDLADLNEWYRNAAPEDLTADWRGNIPTDGWGMDANGPGPDNPSQIPDGVGDCGIAELDHWQMSVAACNGYPVKSWGAVGCIPLYHELGGYVLGDPTTDNGTNLQDNLTWLTHNTYMGLHFTAFGTIQPGTWNKAVRIASMRMFGPGYTGINLQNAQETQFPGPWSWVPGGSIAGGHAVLYVAELNVPNGAHDISWGADVETNKAFEVDALEEMHFALTEESVDYAGSNPYGFDLHAMNDNISSLTGVRNPLKIHRFL